MKNIYLILAVILIICMLTMPFISLTPDFSPNKSPEIKNGEQIAVKKGDEILNINMSDYLLGVLGAEIEPTYSPEAIKAQAVAAYTFALYKKKQNKNEKYDIIASNTDQCFKTTDELKAKWGENYEKYTEILSKNINSVKGIYLAYENEPIYAAYHWFSAGKTEACADVFGKDYPYLKATDSIGDLMCPDYLHKSEITVSDFKKAFENKCSLPENAEKFIGKTEKSASGGIKTITVGDKVFSGREFRAALGLRSTNFDYKLSDDKFIFTTRGYGHCVGMSQYGAEYMAKQGSTYKEILSWYYKGVAFTS